MERMSRSGRLLSVLSVVGLRTHLGCALATRKRAHEGETFCVRAADGLRLAASDRHQPLVECFLWRSGVEAESRPEDGTPLQDHLRIRDESSTVSEAAVYRLTVTTFCLHCEKATPGGRGRFAPYKGVKALHTGRAPALTSPSPRSYPPSGRQNVISSSVAS